MAGVAEDDRSGGGLGGQERAEQDHGRASEREIGEDEKRNGTGAGTADVPQGTDERPERRRNGKGTKCPATRRQS